MPFSVACQLLSNAAMASTGNSNAAYWNADTFADDHYSQAKLPTAGTDANYGAGVIVRRGESQGKYYLWFYPGVANTMRVYRGDGGNNFTQIGSDYSVTVNNNSILKLKVSGTTLTPYVDGVAQATQTNSQLTYGYAGIQFWSNSLTLDDWEGGNIGAEGLSIPVAMCQYQRRWR